MQSQQRHREYARQWMRNKRLGLPTRTTKKLTEEEKYEHRKTNNLKYVKKEREERNKLFDTVFGNTCFICKRGHIHYKNDSLGRTILQIHRIDGKKHEIFVDMSKEDLMREINEHKNEYVRLCWRCHKSVHWCMEHFGFDWEKIKLLITE